MELLQLRQFVVVARVQHMTNAAQELNITQPALSKTIRRLERELGTPLFERQGRSIRLNASGHAFLEHVEAMLGNLAEGQRRVRDMAGLEHGEISIVAASLYWIPNLLRQFRDVYPGVQFHLSQRPLSEMIAHLENGGFDLCFQSMPLQKTGVQWQTLLEEEVLLVVPPSHPLAKQKSVSWRRVADEEIVIEPVGNGLRDLIDDYYAQVGAKLRVAYEVDEPAALQEFVKAQLGAGFVPSQMMPQIKAMGLVPLHITEPPCRRVFGMAWRQGHYLSLAARTFQKFVVDYFANLEGARPK